MEGQKRESTDIKRLKGNRGKRCVWGEWVGRRQGGTK